MATASEKRYLNRLASLGCIVCADLGYQDTPAEIHHLREGQGMSQRASHYLAIPLCAGHHRTGGKGVALHAGQREFEALYGTELDLLAKAIERIAG